MRKTWRRHMATTAPACFALAHRQSRHGRAHCRDGTADVTRPRMHVMGAQTAMAAHVNACGTTDMQHERIIQNFRLYLLLATSCCCKQGPCCNRITTGRHGWRHHRRRSMQGRMPARMLACPEHTVPGRAHVPVAQCAGSGCILQGW